MKYTPRNDFVVFRVKDKGEVRGIRVPGISAQGKELTVVAIGPKVENLNVGDRIFTIGTKGQDLVSLPNDPDLYLTRETNVVLIVEEDDKELT